VLLTRKLAERIAGVDLKARAVGDVFGVPDDEARLLVAERWAIVDRRNADRIGPQPTHDGSGATKTRKAARRKCKDAEITRRADSAEPSTPRL
jgi:hypothetical protein